MAKRGRPTLYKTEYCDAIIKHCTDGASIASFAASIDVARDTIAEWANVHEDFSAALKAAKAKCAAWWEERARDVAMGGDGNATMCIFGLKNMASQDWRDKQEVEHSGEVKVAAIEWVVPDAD